MQKLQISLFSGAVFTAVNLPQIYELTNKLSGNQLYNTATKCPTFAGILVHTLVYFVLTYLSMWGADASVGQKLRNTIYGTLIFFFVSNPVTYQLTGRLTGGLTADQNGCPTLYGVLMHAVVYVTLLFLVMFLPN